MSTQQSSNSTENNKRISALKFSDDQLTQIQTEKALKSQNTGYVFVSDVSGIFFKNVNYDANNKAFTSYIMSVQNPSYNPSLVKMYQMLGMNIDIPITFSIMVSTKASHKAYAGSGPNKIKASIVYLRPETISIYTGKNGDNYSVRVGVHDVVLKEDDVESKAVSFEF